MAYRNIEEGRAKTREHYRNNKDSYKARSKTARQKHKEYVRTIKEQTPCADCGQKYHYCVMDFDHRPGEEKYKEVCKLTSSSFRKLKEEIDKCDIVCANCHRQHTFKRRISLVEE